MSEAESFIAEFSKSQGAVNLFVMRPERGRSSPGQSVRPDPDLFGNHLNLVCSPPSSKNERAEEKMD
jgi:hypothetical protein